MNTYFYRLTFKTPVHFGQGRLSGSGSGIFADTLFSALYIEALGMGEADKLLALAKDGSLSLSDLFPFSGAACFVPKPIMRIQTDKKGDSSLKKKFKGLTHIPVSDIDEYIGGDYDPDKAAEKLRGIGKSTLRQSVRIVEDSDNEPYSVGLFTFAEGCGLYFAASVSDETKQLLDRLMTALSFAGIGGERSSGLGKFSFECTEADESFKKRLNVGGKAMSLSVCLPTDNELETAMKNATFETVKRSGFVGSESYADTPLRKRDLYCFKAGSVFADRFAGDIFDVSTDEGRHPVYRYARPMWFSVDRG